MTDRKIVSLESVVEVAEVYKSTGRKVVTINGCFDVLHPGHKRALEEARSWGSILIVGIDSDATIKKRNKGPGRPINYQEDRAEMIAALQYVDFVNIFNFDNCIPWLDAIKTSIHANGPEYPRPWIEEPTVKKHGGICRVYTRHKDKNGVAYGTTEIERRIREANQ